jgi:hypothetical protein
MSETTRESREVASQFSADDARAIARTLIESPAGRKCNWSAAALETMTAIILWEALKGDGVPAASETDERREP